MPEMMPNDAPDLTDDTDDTDDASAEPTYVEYDLHLTEDEIRLLEELAHAEGVSASEYVRRKLLHTANVGRDSSRGQPI